MGRGAVSDGLASTRAILVTAESRCVPGAHRPVWDTLWEPPAVSWVCRGVELHSPPDSCGSCEQEGLSLSCSACRSGVASGSDWRIGGQATGWH